VNTVCYRRLVRLLAGPVAVAGVIGGAMGMSAIAQMNTAPTATHPIPVSHILDDR
jgi:hypothetical protein